MDFKAEESDPDFEETEYAPLNVMNPEGEVTPHPEILSDPLPDEERSISNTLINLMKSIFGTNSPEAMSAQPPPVAKRLPSTFPADETASFNSFDSMTDEDTARQVQEALARMARGEEPFDQ